MANTLSGTPQNQADDYSDFERVSEDDPIVGTLDHPVVGQLDGQDDYRGFNKLAAYGQGYATKFADQNDLDAYHNAKARGATEEEALAVGDNGIGSQDLGGVHTSQSYGVAVPRSVLEQHFGKDPAAWRKARAMVTVNGQRATVPIIDEGPGSKAQSNGVVTDLSGPLAYALGSSGFDPVNVSLVHNAGPDYMTDPEGWQKEQQRIISRLPHVAGYAWFTPAGGRPRAQAPDNNPIVGQLDGNQAPTGNDNNPIVGRLEQPATEHDYSGFIPAQEQQGSAEQQQPAAKPQEQSQWWDIGKAWQNLFGTGSQTSSQLDARAALDDLNRAKAGIGRGGLFEPVRKAQDDEILADPNASQEQKDTIISGRNDQLKAEVNAAQDEYNRKTQAADEAGAALPGPDYQKTIPGIASKFIGQNGPYLFSGFFGPMAPAALGIQMSESAYGENFERDSQKLKAEHPEMSDDEIRTTADKAAREASQWSFETGIVAGMLPTPKVGPLVQRMVQTMGFRGAYMTIAGASQDIQDNLASKKYIDPKQAVFDGIVQNLPANFLQGAVFGFSEGIAHPLWSDPNVITAETPHAPGRVLKEIVPPTTRLSGHQTGGYDPEASSKTPAEQEPPATTDQPRPYTPRIVVPPVQPGQAAAPVEENGETATVEPDEKPADTGRTAEPTTEAGPSGSEAVPGGIRGAQIESGTEEPSKGASETEERRPAEQLSDSDRQQIVGKVRSNLEVALNKFRPLFQALGVPITEDSRYGALVTPTQNGSVAGFNAAHLADNFYQDWLYGGTHYADPSLVNDTVEHELIHAAWIDAQHRRWLASGQQTPWLTFHYTEASGIDEAIKNAINEARRTGNNELENVLRKGYEGGLSMYTYGGDPEQELSPAQRAAEIVRQLVQLKTSNRISEDFNHGVFANLLGHLQKFYVMARSRLVELLHRVENKTSGAKELELAVNETNQRLSEIGYLKEFDQPADRYAAPQRPEDYTPGKEGDVAYHGPRQLAEKILLPNREVVAKQPHTEELIKALDEFRAREGELHGKVAEINRLFKTLKRRNPNLDKEIDQIGRYVEQNRRLPAGMSPEAQVWLRAANNGLYREIGDRMRAGGFKTLLPDGSTRPFIGARPDVTPIPRVMRPDVQRILNGSLIDGKTGAFTPEAQKLYQEGVNAGFFKKPEDLTEWARQYRMDHSEKPNITNLERARTTKYPSFFYTYSPQAMLDRLFWQSTELARLETFGQKLPGQTDLFDKTADKINADMTLGGAQKQHAFEALEALRRTVYGQNKRSAAVRLMRGISSAGLAGSPHTSAKIGLSMLFNIPQYRGLARTLTGILDAAVHPVQTYAELRRLGLSSETLINIHDDPYSVQTAERRASNIFTGVLKAAGHSLAQDIGKAVTMRVSKSWIERAAQILQRDPQMKSSLARQVADDIRRRGVDPAEFAKGNISQALKDRFVREDVNDLQTAYRPEDYPAWQATGMGSVMFQFGHWAYNGARAITREAVMPMVRAFSRGDVMLGSRYFGRLVGLSLAAGGAAEAWRELDQLFGRQPAVATIGEIMRAFIRNNPESAHMLTARLIEDILTSPVLGTFGDIANLGRNVTKGAAGETHFFNPAAPAAVGYLTIIASAVNQAFQQGGRLSNRQKVNILSQLAALPKGYYDLANTALGAVGAKLPNVNVAGIPVPGQAEAMGRRENSFAKSRLDLFYQMHPEFDKRQKGGSYAGNAHTPYLQDLNEALLAGNVADARDIVRKYRVEQKLDPKTLATSLRESVNSHRPVPGGTAGQAFTRWAARSLTPEELQRMRAIERTYERTAQRTGISLSLEPSQYAPQ